jgi:hypothetical protein
MSLKHLDSLIEALRLQQQLCLSGNGTIALWINSQCLLT